MARTDRWMPLYIGDYLADTAHLNAEQHGAYLLLLMHHWRTGFLPTDDTQLATISSVSLRRWRDRINPVVRIFFDEKDGRLFQKRLVKEMAKTVGLSEKRAQAGDTGASVQWKDRQGEAGLTRAQRLAKAREKGRHTKAEWSALLLFCGGLCVRCGATGTVVKDHITPIYQGGSDAIENIQPLCPRCNSSKGAETTDFRPNAWQNALGTPGKNTENAWQTPAPVQPQLQEEESKQPLPSDSEAARGPETVAPSRYPSLDDPEAVWFGATTEKSLDDDGVTFRPTVDGYFLKPCAEQIAEVAGLDLTTWRNDWSPLVQWMYDRIDYEHQILPAIRAVVSRRNYEPPKSLKYFDQAVRHGPVRVAHG